MKDLRVNRRVRATQEELAEWARTHPHRKHPSVYRVECDYCGKRYWGSGLGVGSHNRGCPTFKLEGDEYIAARDAALARQAEREANRQAERNAR